MAQRSDAAKQSHWLERIRRWQRSQMTVRAFCQCNCVSEASFYSWRRVLRDRGLLEEPTLSKDSADARAFLQLTASAVAETGSAIELVLHPRRLLRVRPGFDADLLLELVRLLEEPAC
jgi:hypothetical protein